MGPAGRSTRLAGSVEARPAIISVKKIPIESTWAEFWKVWFMPPPAPRSAGGRLFMIPARLGDANRPIAESVQQQDQREGRVGEVDRQQLQQEEADSAATSIPPVANGRAP